MKKVLAGAMLQIIVALSVLLLPAWAEGPSFLVEPVYPENQRDRNGYFDLAVTPGMQQDLTILVSNFGEEDITVEVEAVAASTAPDGFIDYVTPGVRDAALLHPFDSLAVIPEPLVKVPAGEQAAVTVTVRVPGESFEGMILGGLRVLKLESEDNGGMIVNAYQYALAVVLSEEGAAVKPDFELAGIRTGLENYRAAVTADIRNTQPAPVRDAAVEAEIFQAGQDAPLFRMEKTVSMAPQSVWSCQFVDQAGYGFQPGNYRLWMRLEHGGREWEWSEDFTITQDEASNINSGAVNQQAPQSAAQGFPLWVTALLCIGLLLLIVLVVLLIILLRKKK